MISLNNLKDDTIVPLETAAEYLCLSKRKIVELAAGRDRSSSRRRLPCLRYSKKNIAFYVGDLKQFAADSYLSTASGSQVMGDQSVLDELKSLRKEVTALRHWIAKLDDEKHPLI